MVLFLFFSPVLILILFVAALLAWFFLPQWSLRHLDIPRAPPSSWWAGNLPEMIRDGPIECATKWHLQFGKLVKIQKGRHMMIQCSDVDIVKEVLSNIEAFSGRNTREMIFAPPRNNMFWMTGPQWKSLRKSTNPAFHAKALNNFAPLMNRCSKDVEAHFAGGAGQNSSVDVGNTFKNMALDVIGSAAFGHDLETVKGVETRLTKKVDAFAAFLASQRLGLVTGFLKSVVQLPRSCLSMLPKNAIVDLLQTTKEIVFTTLSERRGDDDLVVDKKYDLLTLLMGAVDPDTNERLLSDEDVVENSNLFLFGGHETTGTALGFVLYHISQNPDVEANVLAEIKAADQAAEGDADIERKQLEQHKYLDWVLSESMRLLPVAAFVNRVAVQDVVVGGKHVIPKGGNVNIPLHLLHHSEEFWPNPTEFRPERFDPSSSEFKLRPRFAFIPFGGGPRLCIGYKFALHEMKTSLIRILRRFRFTLDESKTRVPLKLGLGLTRFAVDGIHMHVHHRN